MSCFVNINQSLAKLGVPAYVMGDFNVNLLKYPLCARASEMVQAAISYSFLPLFSKPSWFATRSITLINNIFTNHLVTLDDSVSYIIDCSILDYFLLYHTISCSKPRLLNSQAAV